MDTDTLDCGIARPQYRLCDIPSKAHWILRGIEDLNGDALDAICWNCDTPLSWAQWLRGRNFQSHSHCHSCGERVVSEDFSRDLPRHHVRELRRADYFARTWYHATRDESWVPTVQEAEDGKLFVHAGSLLSALSRADDLYSERSSVHPTVYLHSFQLKDPGLVSPTIFDDMMDDWPIRTDLQHSMRVCLVEGIDEEIIGNWQDLEPCFKAAPYYNRYELPGDISLILAASLIDGHSVTTVELLRDETIS